MTIKRAEKITAPQFFLTAFVSQAVLTVGWSTGSLGGESLPEAIVSYLLAMGLGLILALPIWGLEKKYPGCGVNEAAQQALGPIGRAVPIVYLLFFLINSAVSLGLFQIFLLDTVDPEFSSALAMAAVLAAAAYGACRGIETVARCGVCVFAILLTGCALIFSIVARRFTVENLEPLYRQGFSQTLRGTLLFYSRTSLFAELAVLLPFVKGSRKRGLFGWAAGAAAFGTAVLLLLAGCLGPYAATQNFPVFSLSSITEVRSMQRLDAVFVGVWIMGLIVRLALLLCACRACFSSLLQKPMRKAAVLIPAGAVLLLAWAMVEVRPVQRWLLHAPLALCGALLTALLPLLPLLGKGKEKA